MSFFDGEACPDDNLKGILSIHLKLGKYIHSIKIWKSLDFGIDWSRNGRVINYIPRRKSGIYWIQVRRAAAAAAAAVEISLWTR